MPANPQVTDEMCLAAAQSDGEFDGRGWLAMPRAERERYLERSRAALTAALADHVVVHRSDVTYDMVEAGISALASDDARSSSVLVWDIYRAMISAAPIPQKEG